MKSKRRSIFFLRFFSLDKNNMGITVTKFTVVRYFIEH